jgi:putative lipase involved disintegration of autophagic bodies
MSWLQTSHHLSIYARNIKGNHIPEVYIYLKMISVNISALHTKVCDCYTKTSICNIKNFI